MEVAVVGRTDFVIGFRLAGIRKIFVADSDEKLVEHITRVLDDDSVGILVLSNQDMNRIPRRLQATLENSVKPTVIAIGSEEGGMSMREKIKRSVGVDLWK